MFQNIFITNGDDTGQPPQVYLWDDKKGLQILPWSKFNYAFVKSSTGQYKSIFGDSLEKISKRKTKQYNAGDVFESDVPRETRVLIDRYLNDDSVSTNHCLGIIDIETDSSGGFPNIQEADKQIVSIAGYNNNTDVTTVFALPPIPGIFSDFVSGKTEYKFFNSEYDLLLQFLLWWNAQNFTILTHWNGDNFDVPYLYRRLCRVHDEDTANMLSPIGIVRYSEFRNRFQIAGVSSIDYMVAFKKYTLGSRPSYRLGAIAQEIVGETKVEYEGSLNDLYVNNFEKFLEYNIQDVHLIKRMDDKLKYIDLIQNICHISHVPYEDFQYSSRFIEGTILTYLHRKNVISPNKHANHRQLMNNRFETDDNAFEGAYVKDPVVGLHEWVFSLDVESLYPSVMRSLNISAEKKVGKILNFDTQEKIQNKEKTYDVVFQNKKFQVVSTDLDEFLDNEQVAVSANGILYSYDGVGVIPEVLSNWFVTRKQYKDLSKQYSKNNNIDQADYYDRLQNVFKVFLNSIYGSLGLPSFRFYDLDNSEAVTLTGQEIIKGSEVYTKEIYRHHYSTPPETSNVIYIDTDSLYISALPALTNSLTYQEKIDTTKTLSRIVETGLNNFYPVFLNRIFGIPSSNNKIRIKSESIAKSTLFIAKKRYALAKVYDLEKDMPISESKPPEIKGIDVRRSTFPKKFKEFMTELLKDILNGASRKNLDIKVLDLLETLPHSHYTEIAIGKGVKAVTKYEDTKISTFVNFTKGTPSHVKAAITHNRLMDEWDEPGIERIKNDDKIKYVWLKPNPYQIDVVAFKGYNDSQRLIEFIQEYIDPQEIFKRELEKKLQSIYDALSFGLLPTKQNQTANKYFTWD